jgi:hypothetical protein
LGLQAASLAAAASCGFLLAVQPQSAAADGLLPTVSTPSLPITLPAVTLPTVTPPPVLPATTTGATTTTTAATATTAAAAPATTTTYGTPAAPPSAPPTSTNETAGTTEAAPTVAGARRLPDGSISIDVGSVRLPNRLVLAVTVSPHSVQAPRRSVTVAVRVRDTRGYVVRGAQVSVRGVRAGTIDPVARKRTQTDGRAAFVVRAKPASLRSTRPLPLRVNAADPVQAAAASVSRAVSVRVRPRRR